MGTATKYQPQVGRADKHASNVQGPPADFGGPVIPEAPGRELHYDTDEVHSGAPTNNSIDNFRGKAKMHVGTDKQVMPDRQLREQ
jgi:hypothetical protein